MSLSVIVPAYREAGRINDTVHALRAALDGADTSGGVEIVVVDDGSDDGTADAARDAGADIVVELGTNQGKGAAVRAGMRASTGTVVAFTDADLAYAPGQIVTLLAEVAAGADVVVGNRRDRASVAVTEVSRLRRAGSVALHRLCEWLGLGHGRDTQCGLKAFSRRAADLIADASVMDRFSFDVEALFLADRLGLRVVQVPVEVVNSASSSVRVVRDGTQLVIDMVRIRARALAGRYPSPDSPSAEAASSG